MFGIMTTRMKILQTENEILSSLREIHDILEKLNQTEHETHVKSDKYKEYRDENGLYSVSAIKQRREREA